MGAVLVKTSELIPHGLRASRRQVWNSVDFEGSAGSIRAMLFGEMARAAVPLIEAYHSDLFHDAEWVGTNVEGPIVFHYLVRDSGTNIGDSALIALKVSGVNAVSTFFTVSLTHERYMWIVTLTEMDKEAMFTLAMNSQ